MKSKEFKRYCEDFPFLPALVQRTAGKHAKSRPNSENIAFVAVKPWEKLDINDYSHFWTIGDEGNKDRMGGRVRYHVIWKAERKGDSWYHQNGIYEEVSEVVHSGPLRTTKSEMNREWFHNVAQRIQQIQVAATTHWTEADDSVHIEAVVRIAWTEIHMFRSPMTIEIYRYPKQ